CNAEAPFLEELRRRERDRSGLDVIHIDIWEGSDPKPEVERFCEMWGLKGAVLLDETGEYARSLGVRGVPTNPSSTRTAPCAHSASAASKSSIARSSRCCCSDVARIRSAREEEQVRARRERHEHDDERPLQAAAPAAEHVVADGAEQERRERLRERAQQRPDRLRTPP